MPLMVKFGFPGYFTSVLWIHSCVILPFVQLIFWKDVVFQQGFTGVIHLITAITQILTVVLHFMKGAPDMPWGQTEQVTVSECCNPATPTWSLAVLKQV